MKKWLSAISVITMLLSLQSPALANPASMKQAVDDYKAGKYPQALSAFGELVSTNPSNMLVHYYLALCHQALNHRTQAQAEYEIVAQRGDATLKSHAAKGLQVLQAGRASTGSSVQVAAKTPVQNTPTAAAGGPQKVKKIIKWYADWCGPCKAFAPVFEATKPKYRDITFQELDLDDQNNAGLKSLYKVTSIPRLIFLDASNNVLYNGGAPSEQADFEAQINKYK